MKLIERLRQRRTDIATLKNLLEAAEEQAVRRGDGRVGAEHLLLAAFDLVGDDSARAAFAAVNLDASDFLSAIEQQHRDALGSVGMSSSPELGNSAAPKKAFGSHDASFEAAVQGTYKAHGRGGALRGAHVVEGVCSVEHGVAARAIAAMGTSRDELAAAANALTTFE